jgi:UDP-N-acetylglucosamine:LPS N-acetylglucosamine transferase
MKICIVSSCGGHLTEVRQVRPAYEPYDHFYVLNKRITVPEDMAAKTVYFIRHSERDLLFFTNLLEAWRILRSERPHVILSTGAGPAVPFAVVGRLLGVKVLFIETLARIHAPSLTGRLMYRLSNRFFYQFETLASFFPRGECGGPLL